MSAMGWIALWGIVAMSCAVAGGIIAYVKRRDHSFWAAWCFIFPPVLLLLLMLSSSEQRQQPRRLDDEDTEPA